MVGAPGVGSDTGKVYVVFGSTAFAEASYNLGTIDAEGSYALLAPADEGYGGFSVAGAGEILDSNNVALYLFVLASTPIFHVPQVSTNGDGHGLSTLVCFSPKQTLSSRTFKFLCGTHFKATAASSGGLIYHGESGRQNSYPLNSPNHFSKASTRIEALPRVRHRTQGKLNNAPLDIKYAPAPLSSLRNTKLKLEYQAT